MIYLFAAFLLILIAVLWFRTRLTEKMHTQMQADAATGNIPPCELEIPEAFAAGKAAMIESFASAAEAGETGLPAVYLETNCLPGSIIPLMEEENLIIERSQARSRLGTAKDHREVEKSSPENKILIHNNIKRARARSRLGTAKDHREVEKSSPENKILIHNNIKELFIARVTQDGPERDYMKPDCVYLCISPVKQMVSRPNENRFGHARIFHGERDDYYLEDLGSKVGTFLNKKLIKAPEPLVLQDDDVIDIGGKKGIRMVFKRAR